MAKNLFQPGKSGNINGRPAGQTPGTKIRKAIELRSNDILQAVIDAAIGGDMQACKMLLDRITPPLKPQALPVSIPLGNTLPETGGNILTATLSGQVPPELVAS